MASKKKIKVVVCVEGGVVQGIFANSKDLDVVLIDHDNLEEEGKTSNQRADIVYTATEGLFPVPF